MKKILLGLSSVIFCFGAYGQSKTIETNENKNKIAVNFGTFKYFNVYGSVAKVLPVKGISYQHQISSCLGVRAGFSFWNNSKSGVNQAQVVYLDIHDLENKSNDKWLSYKFNFYDVQLVYWKNFSHHNISFLAGPSFATYENGYIKNVSYIILPDGTKHSLGVDTYTENKNAFGLVFGTEYNYSFSQRLDAGIFINGRVYPNDVPLNLNFGVQAGFNF